MFKLGKVLNGLCDKTMKPVEKYNFGEIPVFCLEVHIYFKLLPS